MNIFRDQLHMYAEKDHEHTLLTRSLEDSNMKLHSQLQEAQKKLNSMGPKENGKDKEKERHKDRDKDKEREKEKEKDKEEKGKRRRQTPTSTNNDNESPRSSWDTPKNKKGKIESGNFHSSLRSSFRIFTTHFRNFSPLFPSCRFPLMLCNR